MAITLNGSTGITTPTYGGSVSAEYITPVTGFKNRIINGAMVIDQRNAGASITPSNGQYTLDRFLIGVSQASKLTTQQSSIAANGFTNSLNITSSTAYSILSGDLFYISQPIEGFNCADLNWGTANASTVTLSFWVRSSLTGTFGGALSNGTFNRSYPFTYTISSANTWEQKSIIIAGDTTGTWATNNTLGIQVIFGLGVGSTYSGTAGAWAGAGYVSATGATSVVGTAGATFYITGVQLEKGDTATSFDYRPYGTELALCQRYAATTRVGFVGVAPSTNVSMGGLFSLPVTMRATPTFTQLASISASNFATTAPFVNEATTNAFRAYKNTITGSTAQALWTSDLLAVAEL